MATISTLPSFVADCTLGKLSKYLRLAGFDTLYDSLPPDPTRLFAMAQVHRKILTRSLRLCKTLSPEQILFIEHNDPHAQARQVMQTLQLRRSELRPLTRCAVCNHALQSLAKEDARGRVPEYIAETLFQFQECGQCKRVYWQGTHARRWSNKMDSWFE